MDRNSHWASTDVGAGDIQQAAMNTAGGTAPAAAAVVASRQGAAAPAQGWALVNKQQTQGGEVWAGTSSSRKRSLNENAGGSSPVQLDDAIDQFGSMTIGAGRDKGGFGNGAVVKRQHAVRPAGGGGTEGLSMGSLRVAGEAAGGFSHPVRPLISLDRGSLNSRYFLFT